MRLLIVGLYCFLALGASAQLTENRAHVWLRYGYGAVDNARYNHFGLSGEFILNRYVGLNYNFDLVYRTDSIRNFHTSVGALAGPPLILIGLLSTVDDDNVDNSDFNLGPLGALLGLVILAAPDGVSFHIPASYRWDISPYANVLGLDFVKNRSTGEHWLKYAMSFGVRSTFLTAGNVTLNGFVETRKVAGQGWSIGGGAGVGYAFGKKKDAGTEQLEFR